LIRSRGETDDEDNFEDFYELKEPETFTCSSEEEFFGLPTVDNRPTPDADEAAPDGDFDPTGSGDHVQDSRRRPQAFTRRWRAGFLKRQGLSLRHPHMRRRPAVDHDRELSFLEQTGEVFAQFAPELMYNMDETWRCLTSSHEITITPRGAKTVKASFSGDPKQSLTVIAMINAAGEEMSLWLIRKGTMSAGRAGFNPISGTPSLQTS
jgi:hypothetical protein